MYASQNAARRPAVAEISQCLRVGAPPYRFSGYWLASHKAMSGPASVPLFIDLWQRRRGGFTIAFSRWTGEAWCPDACNAASLEAAMDLLEEICATQGEIFHAQAGPAFCDLAGRIAEAAIFHEQLSTFRHLAGRAMDDWMDIEPLP